MDQQPTTDAELIHRAKNGDERAFQDLVTRYADILFRLARVLLPGKTQDAEDVVQETFLGALKGLNRFEGRSSVKTWLTGICIRQARDARRRMRVRKVDPLESWVESDQDTPAESTSRKMDTGAMLACLSEEHKEVLVLRELDGYSYEEIAKLLDIPIGTVESRIFRARQVVRERFAGYLGGDKP